MDALGNLDFEVYKRLDHPTVLNELGEFELDGNYYRFNCPNCQRNQGKAKNTVFARKGSPYAHCRLCGYRLSWWSKYGDGSQGLQRLSELAGISTAGWPPETVSSIQKALRHSELLEELFYFTNASLFEDRHAEALAYLYSKGLGMEEIVDADLGYYPSHESVRGYILSLRYSLDELQEAGILAPELGTRYKLVLPYRNAASRALGLLAYSLGGGGIWPDKRLFCLKEAATPFNLNFALRSKEFTDSKRLIVVDEPLEAALLRPLGVNNVIALIDERLSGEILALLKRYGVKELVFCLKEVNPQKINDLASSLAIVEGVNLSTFELRIAKSLYEFIRSRGTNALKELLKRATVLSKEATMEKTPAKESLGAEIKLKEERQAVRGEAASEAAEKAKTSGVTQERVPAAKESPPSEVLKSFHMKEVLEKAAKRLRLKTGYPGLDRFPLFSQNELSILMGKPGCGKTLLALNLLLNMMSYHEDLSFILFSSEEAEQLTLTRLLGILSERPLSQVGEELKKGEYTLEVKKGLDLLKGMGFENRFYFFGHPGLTSEEIFS
ncbi:MAG TPA: DnaB-like helicase C-terminal domain-containing protein, partial [Candidatus Hypogeohydataceae bacterium YC40]